MFRKILLPIDLSDKHGPALDVAGDLARRSGGEVVLLHVVELIPGLPQEEEKSFYSRLERLADAHLQKLGNRLAQKQVAWQGVVLLGNRGPEILRQAKDKGTDLIVLTAPHLDPASPGAGWGSLSYKVSLFAPCPVLLVK